MNVKTWLVRSVLLLAGIGLVGCASVVPPSAIADAAKKYASSTEPTPAASAAGLRLGTPARFWWREFHDARLEELVRQASERNHDVQAALATVREARALAGLAGHEALPAGSLNATAQRLRPATADVDYYEQGLPRPPARRLVTLGQSVFWELDLFGRIGTAAAMAERQADMAAADAHAAMALVQAEVVRQYVLLRRHQAELAALQSECDQLQRRHLLMRARVEGGIADPRQADAAAGEWHQALAEQANMRFFIAQEQAALAVLTGRSPTLQDAAWADLLAPGELPAVPDTANLVQPTELLLRRPDVARADAALRASLGEVVLAERAYLPRISLNVVAGLSGRLGDLGSAGALRHAFGPTLQWDWLSSGRLQAREAAARAGSERMWHLFEQTVLKAIEDSENALRAWVATRDAFAEAVRLAWVSDEAARYSGARALSGVEPEVRSLESAVANSRAQRGKISVQGEALLAYARVQLALAAWQ